MKNYTIIDKCPITAETNHITYFDLGNMPLVNNLSPNIKDSLTCNRYPLKINLYLNSGLSTLSHSVNSDILFSSYLYKSNVSKPYIEHCNKMYSSVKNIVNLKDNDLIIDIGGNDGTLLSEFKLMSNINLNYLNIDPSQNLAHESQQRGIPTLTTFFSKETPKLIGKKAKVIFSTNVFQHLKDVNSFADGIYELLDDNGIWLLEFPYWIHDLETKQFDQIYHEHVYYYTVTSLFKLLEKHNLKIISIIPQKIHGGTLRMIITKDISNYISDDSCSEYISNETKYDVEYYKNWGNGIKSHLEQCEALIKELKQDGKHIVAFGAAAKGCIFLNAANLSYSEIDYIIDDTDLKQGKYMPGTGLEIKSRDISNLENVDYILILAHNFADYIIESFKGTYKGKFITFLPEIKII